MSKFKSGRTEIEGEDLAIAEQIIVPATLKKHGRRPGETNVERYYWDTYEIITTRCLARMRKIRLVMKRYGMPAPTERVQYDLSLEREIMGYQLKQFERYKEQFPKSNYLRDIFNADTKDTSLFRIISFDRAWLFTDSVKERVLKAQEEGDCLFLRSLGEAIAKEPKIKPLRAAAFSEAAGNYQRVIDFAEAYIDSVRANSPGMILPRGSIRALHDLLLKYQKWVPSKLSEDPIYFRRFLERNSVILPYKARKELELFKKKNPSSTKEK